LAQSRDTATKRHGEGVDETLGNGDDALGLDLNHDGGDIGGEDTDFADAEL
jgi:hypothetical protein